MTAAKKTPAAAADDAAASALTERLVKFGERLDVVEPTNHDEAWERSIEEYDRGCRALVRSGFYFLWLKNQLARGEFHAGLESRHIAPRRAREAMQVAKFLMSIASADSPKRRTGAALGKLLNISPKKAMVLSRVDPEILVNQGDLELEDIDCMSIAQLKKTLIKTRQKSKNSEAAAEHWRAEAQALRHAAGVATAGAEQPAAVTRARSEGAALADQGRAVIGALERQVEELLAATDIGDGRAERARNIEAAARPLILHLGAVAHMAFQKLEHAREILAQYLPDGEAWGLDDQPSPLTVEQAAELARWRGVHIRQMEADAAAREATRVARGEIKRKPGRPKKSAVAAAPKKKRGRPRKGAA